MKTVLYCVRLEETNWSEDTFVSTTLDNCIEYIQKKQIGAKIHFIRCRQMKAQNTFTEMDTRQARMLISQNI